MPPRLAVFCGFLIITKFFHFDFAIQLQHEFTISYINRNKILNSFTITVQIISRDYTTNVREISNGLKQSGNFRRFAHCKIYVSALSLCRCMDNANAQTRMSCEFPHNSIDKSVCRCGACCFVVWQQNYIPTRTPKVQIGQSRQHYVNQTHQIQYR